MRGFRVWEAVCVCSLLVIGAVDVCRTIAHRAHCTTITELCPNRPLLLGFWGASFNKTS